MDAPLSPVHEAVSSYGDKDLIRRTAVYLAP